MDVVKDLSQEGMGKWAGVAELVRRGPGEPVGGFARVGSNPTPGASKVFYTRSVFIPSAARPVGLRLPLGGRKRRRRGPLSRGCEPGVSAAAHTQGGGPRRPAQGGEPSGPTRGEIGDRTPQQPRLILPEATAIRLRLSHASLGPGKPGTGGRLSNTWPTYPRVGDNPGKAGRGAGAHLHHTPLGRANGHRGSLAQGLQGGSLLGCFEDRGSAPESQSLSMSHEIKGPSGPETGANPP